MIYALYSDGATYRVLYDPAERKTYLATTTGGQMEVPYTVNGASFIRFDFRYVPEKGLRATDVYDNRARFTKDYSKDLNQLDAARSQLSDIIKNADKTKKLPGADAVVGIFDAIGISSAPLKGRGFRINSQVVSEHVEGTRNAWQSMALKLSRLTPEGTGQIVSLEQLKDYQRIMDQARQDAYVGAANDAVNRGIGIQFAPRGNGQPVDENTMDIFLTLSKGDPKLASTLLKQYGWLPPQGD